MKHRGSVFEYQEERDRDLLRAYRQQIGKCGYIVLDELLVKVVNMPSCRFWVSEERVAIVFSKMQNGDMLETMRPTTREMYFELHKRMLAYLRRHPDASFQKAAFHVVRQQAPKFYMTPLSAQVIINRAKRNEYLKRKQQLRHMF